MRTESGLRSFRSVNVFPWRVCRSFWCITKKDVPEDLGDCQIVICGHSHQYAEERKDGRLWLNPGSCGKRRFHQDITMAVLHLGSPEPDAWRVERIDIPHGTAGNEAAKMPSGDMLQTVEKILKKLEKGQTIPAAARELKLNPEFVEEYAALDCSSRYFCPGNFR